MLDELYLGIPRLDGQRLDLSRAGVAYHRSECNCSAGSNKTDQESYQGNYRSGQQCWECQDGHGRGSQDCGVGGS